MTDGKETGETLSGLIEAQAERTPDAIAVIDGDTCLTYAELIARARSLAGALLERGVGPGAPVGICVERSSLLPVGLLAVMEAGGICLPLDPSYPPQRLAQLLADAGHRVVVATGATATRLPPNITRILRIDVETGHVGEAELAAARARIRPEFTAYLIYTSGSTGEPKGVMLTHRGLVHHARAIADLYRLGPSDRVLQFASIGFDVSIEEIFPTLLTGGAIVLRDDDVPVLGTPWLDWLAKAGPTVLNLPTAHWHEWVRDLQMLGRTVPESVRLVVVGGERAVGSAFAIWQHVGGERVRWINAYGPAEATVTATAFEGPPVGALPDGADPPIGRPVGCATVHVLDDQGGLVAEGAPGELYLGGQGLAGGYVHRPDLTAERFVRSPVAPGERLYRTGDIVRMLDDGNLAYVGRRDEQVKIRGVRVELGEVESVIARHPSVAEAAVVAREDTPGDRRLVAYVVADQAADGREPLTASGVRRFVAMRLPPQMVPTGFVSLDRMPLTSSGKVDRAALPLPGDVRTAAPPADARVLTETEAAVVGAWSRVLGATGVGADDDFFDLGGQSLQATQIVAALREVLGVDIGVNALFDAPTVAGFAGRIDAARRDAAPFPKLEPTQRRSGERIQLSLSQEHMWKVEANADPPGLLNVTAVHTFREPIDAVALRAALAHVVRRHEALRTRFIVDGGTPFQEVASDVTVDLDVWHLGAMAHDRRDAELQRLLAEQDASLFDLRFAPLFRCRLYRVADDQGVLATTFDHLVCDGTSAYIFLHEVAQAYAAYARGAEAASPPLPLQYADFALWQRAVLTDEALEQQVEYWKRTLAGMKLGPAVPFDHVPATPTRRIVARDITVTTDLHAAIRRLARQSGVTVFVIVAAAFQALCSRASGDSDVVVSTTLSGRRRAEVARLIGCFHSVGRIRTDLSGDPTFTELVARTHTAVAGLLDNSDVPFFRIREAAVPPMPSGGAAFLAAVPTELQYFPTARDEWTVGAGVVERPGPDRGSDALYFRGHMHPLVVTVLDDGAELWGSFSYKVDWYDAETIEALADAFVHILGAVVAEPSLRVSQLPAINGSNSQ